MKARDTKEKPSTTICSMCASARVGDGRRAQAIACTLSLDSSSCRLHGISCCAEDPAHVAQLVCGMLRMETP